jgi:uncharacterized protein (TIGR02996 family)
VIHGKGFLRAIAEHPEDDALRLIYADWLDDQGDPARTEFIRAQVRLEEIQQTIPPPAEGALWQHFGLSRCARVWRSRVDSPERRNLAFRCRSLLDANEEEWLASLRKVLRHEWSWTRGFLDVVDAEPVALADSAAELFGLHPIRRLILTRLRGKVDVLGVIPANNCVASLDLILNDIDLGALRKLTGFKELAGLRELNLSFNRLRDSAVDVLCGEPFFQELSLGVCCNSFTDSGRQRLREHFGSRVSFERIRHPERLFTFSTDSKAEADLPRIDPEYIGTVSLHTGLGSEQVQLLLERQSHTDTLCVFDHAGDLLHIETRSCWNQPETRRRQETQAWLRGLGYQAAAIHVKRFPGIYDFPKSWSTLFDSPDTEAEDHAAGVAFMERWLEEDGFRYGSFCGGWYLNRQTGQPIAP